jgi:nucleotide-binding universal stress UspA family protein
MLKHVLVPLDGSALSEEGLYHAEAILMPKGKFTLLSVIEAPTDYDYALVDIPSSAILGHHYGEAEYQSIYERVKDYLERKAQKLVAKGYLVECIVERGNPANVIHEIAGKAKVDVIVMTSHGRSGLSRWIFGSVTQKVISQMECPVFVIPGLHPVESEQQVETERAAASS